MFSNPTPFPFTKTTENGNSTFSLLLIVTEFSFKLVEVDVIEESNTIVFIGDASK
jgi:hypothetical protein